MRDILVHAADFKTWGNGIEYAARLATKLDAALTGAYVYPSPLHMVPPYGSPALLTAIIENTREIEATARASEPSFVAWAHGLGVRHATWQVAEGYVPDVLAHIGNWTDLLVLQRDPDTAWGSPYDLGALVLRVDIPCIVLPPNIREPRLECIALAWNGAPEAVRAIHAALPLIQRARRVVLLSGERRDSFIEINWKPAFEIEVYLGRHGIVPEQKIIVAHQDHAGTALLETAAQVGADLLVMGAYGRSRFSEWAFGGATRQVLHDAALPVFLRH